jgi:predicted transcriptional regulator
LKNRSNLLTFMEILGALAEGPRLPTKLAQACNINYGRLGEFTGPLESMGYIRKDMVDGHEVFTVTGDGLKIQGEFERLRSKFPI